MPSELAEADGDASADVPAPRPAPLETRPVGLEELPRAVGEADLVICSTGSPEPVLTFEGLGEAIRRRGRLLFIVDIAVPRDVDSRLGRLPNVFLYNMDDLDRVVAANLRRRQEEVPAAEAIVEHELERFAAWQQSLQVGDTIRLLQKRLELLRQAETSRYAQALRRPGGTGPLRRVPLR